MKKITFLSIIILFMLLLLFMPNITKSGAIAGINLCLYSVIPALLPYMLITNYILYSGIYETICSFFQPIIGRIFRISKYSSFIVVLGLLCGYPMGAKLLGEFITSGKISKNEGCYLITFCNNCSISFVVNYIFYTCLNSHVNIYILLALIYLPIFLTAIINRFFYKFTINKGNTKTQIKINNPIYSSIKTVSILCGYVFLFTIIAYFIKNLIPLNKHFLYPIISYIEMTSGTALLSTIHMPFILLFICSSVLFGGLSTVMQTFSLIPKYLRKYYIIGKLEQLVFLYITFIIIKLF